MQTDSFAYLKLFLVIGPVAGYVLLELLIYIRDRRRLRRAPRTDS
jgi:hypothetical protein